MKASDFVSSSSERAENARDLLHTEETDAVNSGIVDSADKGASAVKRAAKGGATNAALAAVTKGRGKAYGEEAADGAGDAAEGPRTGGSLKSRLKGGAKGAAKALAASGVRKELEGTELEGADDLYYKGRAVYGLAKKAKARLTAPDGKRAVSVTGKRGAKAAKDSVAVRRRAQMSRYFKQNVYSSAAKAKTAAKAGGSAIHRIAVSTGGGLRAAIGAACGAVAPVLMGIIALVLLLSAIGGALGGKSGNDESGSASLNATESQVAAYFKSQGLDNIHTAAIMGNMYAESGMDPSCVETGGTGIGICQWSTGRATDLRSYAASQGKAWTDLGVQLDFFWNHDIWQTDWGSSYTISEHKFDGDPAVGDTVSGSKSGFMDTDDLTEAVKEFCYGWERPGIPRMNDRLEAAQRYYAALAVGGGGQDYESAEQWQKDIVDACSRVGWPGASKCATWTNRVYAEAGHETYGNGNSVLGNQGYGANYYESRATTDLSQIQVGMLLSAQYGSNTEAGNTYGHVAIYIGDGMVMDSINTGIRTTTLSEWVADYSRGWVVCGYPWDWR